MARADDAPSIEGDAEERRLIDRSAAGDQEAFRQLVIRHHRLVINVAYRALGELSLAEDVAQEVFLKVYKALPGYRHEKPFKHWLHRVAANAVTDALRRRRPMVSLDGMEQPPASRESDPMDVATRHDLQKAVRQAIASLPSPFRPPPSRRWRPSGSSFRRCCRSGALCAFPTSSDSVEQASPSPWRRSPCSRPRPQPSLRPRRSQTTRSIQSSSSRRMCTWR